MTKLFIPMPGNEQMASALAARTGGEAAQIETRQFPDRETYVRLLADPRDREVEIVCTLADPDPKFLPLCFAAGAARDLGARRVRLVAPYLAYMRQDARFHDGEAITATHFAALVSRVFDGLITVDPHLHRVNDLNDIYSVQASAVSASEPISAWIAENVTAPLILGPDEESAQWVGEIARRIEAPFGTMRKQRLGDRRVELHAPDLSQYSGRRVVLVDDMASSGRTMIAAARAIAALGFAKPHCVVVHPIFGGDAYRELQAEVEEIVSTDTIPHPSNAISVADVIAAALRG